MNPHSRFSISLLVFVGLSFLASVRPAQAHGAEEDHLLDEAPVGPYLVTLTAASSPIKTGRVILTAELISPFSSLPAADREVRFQVVSPGGDQIPVRKQAIRQFTPRELAYEVEFMVENPGEYQGWVEISDGANQLGSAPFSFRAVAASPWVGWIVFGFLIQAVLFGLWLLSNFKKVWLRKDRLVLERPSPLQGYVVHK